MNKSICIATYNGSKYIRKQIASILQQIGENDEIVIVDDCSKDNTVEILESYEDERIKIFKNLKNLRHVRSFEKAISLASNDLIFLSDQDDIWEEGRLKLFENFFIRFPNVQVIASNFYCINDNDQKVENNLRKVSSNSSFNYRKNILDIITGKIGYFGCAMAFRKKVVPIVLPIPENVEAHDLWIAMAGNLLKSNLHIDDKTLYHRIHDNNASDLDRKIYKKIQARIGFIKQYKELKKRIKNYGT